MIITYQGLEFFKIQQGDITLAINPISKDSKHKGARFGADCVLVTTNHPDMNGVEQMEFGDKKPLVISGPGEYETKGVFIKGFASPSHYSISPGKEIINTVYLISFDSMNMVFLGALDTVDIPKEITEAMEDIDILFLPIGGEGVLDPAGAHKLAVNLEPKLIIPMHYGLVGKVNALKAFLKEEGEERAKTEEKLTLKKKDLEGKEGEIVVLKESL
ncbi:MAG: MBL fold metallo-hydrolase [Candidatus Pacebacteria bacterium]|nr:MBL fold metallo-hydrolase [Candidatus Paceibacterota bacterium]